MFCARERKINVCRIQLLSGVHSLHSATVYLIYRIRFNQSSQSNVT